jgi:hypothetical protein
MTYTRDDAFNEWFNKSYWDDDEMRDWMRRGWDAAMEKALAVPVHVSIRRLAQMLLFDCRLGIDNQQALDRIAQRIQRHIDTLAPVQPEQEPVAFYVYEWINPSDGVVFRSFRADEYQCGREPDRTVAVPTPPAKPAYEQEPAGSFMTREMAIEFCRRRRPSIEPTEQHIDRTIDAYAALFGDLVPAPPAAQRKPLTDEEMWNLWNSCGVDEMNQQEAFAFARAIEAAHGIKEKT